MYTKCIYIEGIEWPSSMSYLSDEHVSTNRRGRHVLILVEELRYPVADHREQRHEVFDYL